MAENPLPLPNFWAQPKHMLSATSAQIFRHSRSICCLPHRHFRLLWFMPSLCVRSPFLSYLKLTVVHLHCVSEMHRVRKHTDACQNSGDQKFITKDTSGPVNAPEHAVHALQIEPQLIEIILKEHFCILIFFKRLFSSIEVFNDLWFFLTDKWN